MRCLANPGDVTVLENSDVLVQAVVLRRSSRAWSAEAATTVQAPRRHASIRVDTTEEAQEAVVYGPPYGRQDRQRERDP